MKTTPNRHCLRTLALAVMFFLLNLHGSAATFTLNPAADAFITRGPSGNLSTNNYGGAGALAIAAPNLPAGEFQSVLQFGLAGAKSSFDTQFGVGQWSVQSVTLSLTAVAPNNPIFNSRAAGQFSVSWMQNNGWTEGVGTPANPTTTGITFSSLNNFVGLADQSLGTFNYNGAIGSGPAYSLGLTPSFMSEVLAGNTVSLRMFAADSVVSYVLDSRNFGTASARPLLTITAVPEPGSFTLGLLGLALMAHFRSATRSRQR